MANSDPAAHLPHQNRFFGKYRGKVIDNIDPLFQGRILADVPAIPGSLLNWALPCVPYAGPNVGFYAIPPIGANVWIEFEGGDPDYPIWAGCFWAPEDILRIPGPPPPETKVFKTEFVTLVLNDLPEIGGFTLRCTPPAVDVPLTMTFDSSGFVIDCPEAAIRMTPNGITLTAQQLNCTGALAVEGETNISGALTVEGAVNIAGGLAVEGGGTIDGAPIL